jgi:hypothetical protein
MGSMKDYVGSLFLKELLKGMALTGRHLFARKITIQFPEEKTPQSPRFGVCMRSVVIRMERSVVLHANCVRQFARRWRLRSSRSRGTMVQGEPVATTSTSQSASSVVSVRRLVRLMQ